MRAMYGGEENCGDLIFSGHTAFVTVSVYTVLHGSWTWQPRWRTLGWLLGFLYLSTFQYAVIAARKHYSVDVWLGFLIGTFVYTTFSPGWIPYFFRAKA
jgi:membrane-associated phospholipid phosphatase